MLEVASGVSEVIIGVRSITVEFQGFLETESCVGLGVVDMTRATLAIGKLLFNSVRILFGAGLCVVDLAWAPPAEFVEATALERSSVRMIA